MKLAESVRVRWFLAAASIALVGSSVALLATQQPQKKPTVISVERHEPVVIGGCHERKQKKVVTPAPEHKISGGDYRDALLAIQPAFRSCVQKSSNEVTYRLSIDINADGSVKSVDVRSEAKDMKKVSLKTTACLERAVMTATFPAAGDEKRVSTILRPDQL